jgi:PhoH-like ATPase
LKTFVVDTNVLLFDPFAIKSFKGNEVVVPITVLDELDAAKVRPDAIGRNARTVVRFLDGLRSEGSLSQGVKHEDVIVRVELNHSGNIPSGMEVDKKDNRIISVALGLQKDSKRVVLISKDINMRVKCDVLGIPAEDYYADKVTDAPNSVYTGVEYRDVSSEFIDSLFSNGEVINEFGGFQNQFFVLKAVDRNQVALVKVVGNNLKAVKPPENIRGIKPRNVEQRMAMDLLMNPKIKLVTMIGRAGSGKTLLAVAAGLHYVLSKGGTYNRMLISRPIQPMGRDLGFLPGTIEEKLDPWMQPLYDNLDLLLGADRNMVEMYKEQGIIQVEPLTYIRGRSIPNSLMIVDEAQNLMLEEIKTIITRVGENTKIILTGDIEQIDHHLIDFADNGLTQTVERFKHYDIAGHITLQKCERSELAELGAKIL